MLTLLQLFISAKFTSFRDVIQNEGGMGRDYARLQMDAEDEDSVQDELMKLPKAALAER